MRGEYVQIILQKRNAKTIAIPWLSSAINISIVIMIIMHKRKHKVSEWLNVSFFFYFILLYFNFLLLQIEPADEQPLGKRQDHLCFLFSLAPAKS